MATGWSEEQSPPCDWRGLLFNICNELSEKDMKSLKFLCKRNLQKSSLEKCKDGLDLVTLLEERTLITKEDCSYLVLLLKEVGRKDLSQKLLDADQKKLGAADTRLTLSHDSSLASTGDSAHVKEHNSRSSASEHGGRQGQSYDMTVDKVVKELQEQGIECLFTISFLQNNISLLKGNRARLAGDLKNEEYARRYPLMNLLGFLNYKASDGQHIDMFKNILKEKPGNLLALLNLVFLIEDLGSCEDARKYRDEIVCILGSRNGSTHMARAKYELAEILTAVDAHKQMGGEKIVERLFEEALKCEDIGDDEKMEWKFGFAFFYFKMDSWKGQYCEKYFVTALMGFYDIVTQPSQEETNQRSPRVLQRLNDMISKGWCFIGNMLSRWERKANYGVLSDVPELRDRCTTHHARFTLTDCLLQAKENWMEQNKAMISRRIGVAFLKVNMTYAKEFILKALKIKRDGYGCSLLGRYNLKMYKDCKRDDYLDLAIANFSEAEKTYECDLWHCYRDYAECLFHKGKFVDALVKCKKSEDCGGTHDSSLYSLWARILEKRGDQEGASKKRSQCEQVKSGDFSEKYTIGWLYCDKDASKIGHLTMRLENRKGCNITIFYVTRDMVGGGQESLESWEEIDKKCQWILVYCSAAFKKSGGIAKKTLPGIIQSRNHAGKLETIVPVLESEIQVPHLILKNNKTLKVDDPSLFCDEVERLVNRDEVGRGHLFTVH